MRLTEIQNKASRTAIPRKVYDELMYTEVDTVDDSSPDAKVAMADELRQATQSGAVMKAPLSDESKHYLLTNALPNIIDIAKDNMDRRLVSSLQKFQARLHAKLTN